MDVGYDTFPPSGTDRADGTGQFPGTPTAGLNAIIRIAATPSPSGYNPSGSQDVVGVSYFEEMPDSPEYDFGEQGTVRHTFECDADTFNDLIPVLQRGQVQFDSSGDVSRILNTTAQWQRGNRVRFSVTSEGLSWGRPPDEFTMEPMEINPDLMKHPRYNDGSAGATGNGLTDAQKGAIRFVNGSQTAYDAAQGFMQVLLGGGVDPSVAAGSGPLFPGAVQNASPINQYQYTIQQRMAWEVISKYWRGEDTFYLPAIVLTYTTFYYPEEGAPPMNPGGYIEDPTLASPFAIPYYFWSLDGTDTTGSNNSNNKLQSFAVGNIGNMYSSGVTYLRKADQERFERTWFRRTQTWIGAPTGPVDANGNNYIYWDPDLYSKIKTRLGYPPLGAMPPIAGS